MADEIKFRLRKSKDGKLYQVIRVDGSTRAHFLSLEKFKPPVPVEAIRYGRDPHRMAHRAGAFLFSDGQYWRQFVAIADVDIATAGDASEEQVLESDERVKDFFAMAVPVRVEDAHRALAVANRDKAEAESAPAKQSQTISGQLRALQRRADADGNIHASMVRGSLALFCRAEPRAQRARVLAGRREERFSGASGNY